MLESSSLDPGYLHLAVLVTAGIAAVTDVSRGIIPNWLTLPLIVLSPLVHGFVDGASGLLRSLLGLLVCSAVPLIIWYGKGMAAGDVKVFAAIGALGGLTLGLEVQFLSLVVAAMYAVGQVTWNGGLWASLGRSLLISLNPLLPRRLRRPVPHSLLNRIRLGGAVLLGAAIAVAGHHRGWLAAIEGGLA